MSWKIVNSMDEKINFISHVLKSEISFSKLCRTFEISRPSGYKWWKRYKSEGLEGLLDKLKTPINSLNAVEFSLFFEVALKYTKDYKDGNFPVLNVVGGRKKQNLYYLVFNLLSLSCSTGHLQIIKNLVIHASRYALLCKISLELCSILKKSKNRLRAKLLYGSQYQPHSVSHCPNS